jgi:4-hydroxymandelate oxidase
MDEDFRRFVNVDEFESAAGERLDRLAWDYYRSGAWDETTVRWNRAAWQALAIRYRVLVDVSRRSAAVRLKGLAAGPGLALDWPVLLAPTALHRLAHPDGELATARAAAAERTAMVLSSFSSTAVEAVAACTDQPLLMQLYVGPDREFTLALAERAERAGCIALVLTVDTPVWGTRERDVRNGWHLPPGIDVPNLLRPGGPTGHQGRGIREALGWAIDAALSWRDLTWLAERTRLPVLVKGICRADDALRAIDHGARGIIVSNHGGRQLDGAPATASSLPAVARAVGGRVPVLVDGGIRRGADVLRALALGADAVAVGRPVLWGLACGGESGVRHMLGLLRNEFDLAMALAGCASRAEITSDLVE